MKNSPYLNISCRVVFSSNKWNKKVGSPSSFWNLNSSVFIENLPSSERARARPLANHAKNDAQKGCAMQLNGITLALIPVRTAQAQRFVLVFCFEKTTYVMYNLMKYTNS